MAKKKTGKEVWDSLKARFVGAEWVKDARLQTLKSKFDDVRMKDDDPLDQVVAKLSTLSVKVNSLGGSLDDAALVKKLFDIVPDHYLTVVAGIEQFYDLKTIAFDEAVGRLKAFEERTSRRSGGGAKTPAGQVLLTQAEWEARQKSAGGDSSGKAKKGESSSRGRGRGRGGGTGGRGGRTDGGDGTGKRDKSHIKCFKCHERGHYANRCPGGEKKAEEANLAKIDREPAVLLAEMCCRTGYSTLKISRFRSFT